MIKNFVVESCYEKFIFYKIFTFSPLVICKQIKVFYMLYIQKNFYEPIISTLNVFSTNLNYINSLYYFKLPF